MNRTAQVHQLPDGCHIATEREPVKRRRPTAGQAFVIVTGGSLLGYGSVGLWYAGQAALAAEDAGVATADCWMWIGLVSIAGLVGAALLLSTLRGDDAPGEELYPDGMV